MRKAKSDIIEFYEKERMKLVSFIHKKLYDATEMDVEDIIHEVFANLFNRADISSHVENLAAYIYRSIHNKIIDYIRSRNKTISIEGLVEEEYNTSMQDVLLSCSSNPERDAEMRAFKEKLIAAIDSLDPKQRAVWLATEMEGISFKELSIQWKEPVGTLLSRKSRATKALRKALAEYSSIL